MTETFPASVASALRTLSLGKNGLTAVEEALRAPGESALAANFDARGRDDRRRERPRHRHRHGQIRPCRAQDRRDARFDRPAREFVHPAEASHGDLGMVRNDDVVLALSWSGESVELAAIVTYAKRFAIPLIAMTSSADSALGREADIRLVLPAAQEACPNGLAPTTSTTIQLVLGDALAIALLEAKGFTARDFSRPAPRRQARREAHLCPRNHAQGRAHPRIRVGKRMADAIVEMSSKGFGCVGVFEASGALAGIITDGDLRRHLRSNLIVDTPVEEVMTRSPRTIPPDALVAEALELISRKISALLVVEAGEVVGIVHFHDLLRLGAVYRRADTPLTVAAPAFHCASKLPKPPPSRSARVPAPAFAAVAQW